MNVLAVWHYPMFAGPSNRLLRLSAPLRERGIGLTVALPDEPGDALVRLQAGGVHIESMRLQRLRASRNPLLHLRLLLRFPGDVKRIRQAIRRHQADVVVLTGLSNPHAAVAARLERRAVVWQIVDTRVPAAGRRLLMPFVRALSDTTMFWGQRVQDMHEAGRPVEMPRLLASSPVDLETFVPSDERRAAMRRQLGIPEDALVVGTVANLNPQKGVEYFVGAARIIAAQRSNVWFVVVGGRYDTHLSYARRIDDEVAAAGLEPRFRFVGPRTDVECFYPAMDVMLITSVPASEGIPTTGVEAMACGIPVVTTDVGSAAEAIIDGVTGYVVEPLRPDLIAVATERLLSDEELRRRLGAAARSRAEARHGIAPSVQLHIKAFEAAIRHAQGRRGLRGRYRRKSNSSGGGPSPQ
jgi:glycosyltransferase involved in cell wall biosynthesis